MQTPQGTSEEISNLLPGKLNQLTSPVVRLLKSESNAATQFLSSDHPDELVDLKDNDLYEMITRELRESKTRVEKPRTSPVMNPVLDLREPHSPSLGPPEGDRSRHRS